MKHYIKFGLMGGMILFCLSMCLTSCEDILGEWSKPVPNTVTPGGGDGGGGSDGGGSSTIAVTNVAIDATLRLEMNSPQTLTATISPSDATDQNVTWESTNPAVVTVNTEGKVTPVALGETTIKATVGGKSATCKVYVYDKIWNINSDGAADVPADKFWLIEGNGTAIANSITIGDGATVTLNGINITQQIICSNTGNSTIILADGSTNTVTVSTANKAGIQIGGTGTTLTINGETAGTGTLTAKGGNNGAGIGTGLGVNNICGAITINGGTVTATGGDYGAGIGTGAANNSSNTCGAITINGGTVTATGGNGAAGIGTGVTELNTNTCGAITIKGGQVTATGGNGAAGIGTGFANNDKANTCGNITIGTGVKSVTATKGDYSPNSIGKGSEYTPGTQTCGTITIADPSKVTEN